MMTQGPLVGEAEANEAIGASMKVEDALRQALGKGYTSQHRDGMRKLRAALLAGERSWRTPGIWVTVED